MLNIATDDPLAIAVTRAIQDGDVDATRLLLIQNPALSTARLVDERGVYRTLLHVVADWPGHFPNGAETVSLLVQAGANIDAPVGHTEAAGSPETALHWAASSDDVSVLDALMDAGASVEVPGAVFTGGTPMSDAVIFAQWGAARSLLEHGAVTTIWQAAALGLLDRVRDLWSRDRGIQDEPTNAFWHACRGGQGATASFLLDHGAVLNWVGYDGRTPLDAAQESGDDDLVAWLKTCGAERGPHAQ